MEEQRKELVLEHGHDCLTAAYCLRPRRTTEEFFEIGSMTVYLES